MITAVVDSEKRYYEIINAVMKENGIEDKPFLFTEVCDFLVSVKERTYDVLFLDYETKGINTKEFSDSMHALKVSPMAVYMTDREKIVCRNTGMNMIGFIVQSKIKEELPAILYKIKNELDQRTYVIFSLSSGDILKIPKEDIVFCEKNDRRCMLHTRTNEIFKLSEKSLQTVCDILGSEIFVYINKNFLINANYIHKIESRKIYLTDIRQSFDLPKRYFENVKQTFLKSVCM